MADGNRNWYWAKLVIISIQQSAAQRTYEKV
jgi:hypothetical protein